MNRMLLFKDRWDDDLFWYKWKEGLEAIHTLFQTQEWALTPFRLIEIKYS